MAFGWWKPSTEARTGGRPAAARRAASSLANVVLPAPSTPSIPTFKTGADGRARMAAATSLRISWRSGMTAASPPDALVAVRRRALRTRHAHGPSRGGRNRQVGHRTGAFVAPTLPHLRAPVTRTAAWLTVRGAPSMPLEEAPYGTAKPEERLTACPCHRRGN